ncbi:MAG: DnaJ domain-containing protein [Rhodomicrobiaceae bacterium]
MGPENGGPIDLHGVDLEGAELHNATLIGADLNRARLTAADLVGARLDGADLTGADLTDAVLDGADLEGAILDGAILIGASFTNARGLTQEQIAASHGDASTALPGNLLPPESWFPPLEDDLFTGSPAPEPIHSSDPYDVLGVERTANQAEIRTAFRNLVKMYHPDLNPDDADAQELFKRISIAYRILGDVEKRGRYDRGEIGGDGEISPEFEAKQHFRRYAYRFYTAAAASLVIVVGALAGVWYMVLTQEQPAGSRLEIAVSTPPKQIERLPSVAYAPDAARVAAGLSDDGPEEQSEPATEALGELRSEPQLVAPETSTSAGSQDTAAPPSDPAPAATVSEPATTKAAVDEATDAATVELTEDKGIAPKPAGVAETDDLLKTAAVSENEATPSPRPDGERSPAAAQVPSPPAGHMPVAATSEADTIAEAEAEAGSGRLARLDAQEPAESVTLPVSAEPERPQIDAAQQADVAGPAMPGGTGSIYPEVPDPAAVTRSSQENGAGADASASETEAEIAVLTPPVEQSEPTPSSLGDGHDDGQARPADADTAHEAAPPAQNRRESDEDTAKQDRGEDVVALEEDGIAAATAPDEADHVILLMTTNGRKIGNDPISEMFRRNAIKQALAQDESETTASIAALFQQEEIGAQDEIWDLYTHSRPEPGETQNRPWPEILKTREKPAPAVPVNQSVAPVPNKVIAKRTREDRQEPAPRAAGTTAAREQAVSDILAGGL